MTVRIEVWLDPMFAEPRADEVLSGLIMISLEHMVPKEELPACPTREALFHDLRCLSVEVVRVNEGDLGDAEVDAVIERGEINVRQGREKVDDAGGWAEHASSLVSPALSGRGEPRIREVDKATNAPLIVAVVPEYSEDRRPQSL